MPLTTSIFPFFSHTPHFAVTTHGLVGSGTRIACRYPYHALRRLMGDSAKKQHGHYSGILLSAARSPGIYAHLQDLWAWLSRLFGQASSQARGEKIVYGLGSVRRRRRQSADGDPRRHCADGGPRHRATSYAAVRRLLAQSCLSRSPRCRRRQSAERGRRG